MGWKQNNRKLNKLQTSSFKMRNSRFEEDSPDGSRNKEYKLVNNQIYITQKDEGDKILYDGGSKMADKTLQPIVQDKKAIKLAPNHPYKSIESPKRSRSTMKVKNNDSMASLSSKKSSSIKSFEVN